MVIRWLGAFRKGSATLRDAIEYELRGPNREVAAEPLQNGLTYVAWYRNMVGLVVARSAVRKTWKGDVWSEPSANGRLVKTRRPVDTHMEAACLPVYRAIVIKGRISDAAFAEVQRASAEFKLPVLRLLHNGGIQEVTR